MDITWGQLIEFSGGHSVGGQIIALVPGRGNVCFAERTGQTFKLTEDGIELADRIRASIEVAKTAAAKTPATPVSSAAPDALKVPLGPDPGKF